jgi:hypothetical protein
MQGPSSPPQAKVAKARRGARQFIAEHPGDLVTPHGLVEHGDVERCEEGHPLDFAIAAIDELVASGVLEQIAVPDTYRVVVR